MAAQTCDTNLDFDIDEDLEINIYELVYNDYESCEIELEDIDWDCVDFMEQDEQQELQISFINENDNHISKIVVNANSEHSAAGYGNSDTFVEKATYTCEICKKKYKRLSYFNKHFEKCMSRQYI